MGISFLLSKELKSSVAYESLEYLLDNDDFFRLRNIYCDKESYSRNVQGDRIDYVNVNDRDVYIRVQTFDNKLIECKVYNYHNNIKIIRRDLNEEPILEDIHIYSYDFVNGDSYVSSTWKDVYKTKDGEKTIVTKYNKSRFDSEGNLLDFYKEEGNDNKKRKYK